MDGLADEKLVEVFRDSGEIRHFDELVGRYVGKVRNMIYPMVLNHADADELTQEVFLRVVNGMEGFRMKAKFSSWLYRITVNTTRTFLGKRSRSPLEHRSDVPEESGNEATPADGLGGRETHAEIERALSALSPALRSAITLTAIHGMSVKEATAVEGCMTATMYWRVHEARKFLKKTLGHEVTG